MGSFGAYQGSTELRDSLARSLAKKDTFQIVSSPAAADAIVEGLGELWIRSYHTLSPRARANTDAAEPVYTGYLSVRLRGKSDEILWSYFADPPRVSVHDLKRDLVTEVTDRLKLDRDHETAPPALPPPASDFAVTLSGGGSTFAAPLYKEWFTSFHARRPSWTFFYSPLSSQGGLDELSAGKLDFSGTDIPPEALDERLRTSNGFFPSVGGAVVIVYNLPGFGGELRLTADVISGLFSGSITRWSDSRLRVLNPSANLPDMPVRIFHREPGSGTTFALVDYLAKAGTAWGKSVPVKWQPEWPVGEGIGGNDRLAQTVVSTPYSLGYIEFIYAFEHHLTFASVKNRAGRFVPADLLSIMAAANQAGDQPEDSQLSIVNSPEPSAYPISTLTWIAAPRVLPPDKKEAITTFLEWMLTAGQRQCSGLGYAPLPRNLLDREISAVRKMR